MSPPEKAIAKFRYFCSNFGPILPHFCLFRFVSVDLLLVSVQSKHRKLLFRYRSETTETKVLFRIVPKLVSVPVSVVSNRNYFRRTPYSGITYLRECIPICRTYLHLYMDIHCPASPEKEDQRAAGSPAASTQLALCLRLAIDLKGRKLATRRNPR